MSVENIEGADSSVVERVGFYDHGCDSEKARESQGSANHSSHFYGSSIEQSSATRFVDEVQVVNNNQEIARGGISFLNLNSKKDFATTALLCFFLGPLGVHRFYVDRPVSGALMLLSSICTFGLVGGIWAVIDFVMIVLGSFEDGEGRPIKHK